MPNHRTKKMLLPAAMFFFGLFVGWLRFEKDGKEADFSQVLWGAQRLENLNSEKLLKPRPPLGGRYDAILELCGELCDLTKPIIRQAGDLLGMGTVKAKVDCDAVFSSPEIDRPSGHPAMSWEMIPQDLQKEFSHNGQVDIINWFFDETSQVVQKDDNDVRIYSKPYVQTYIDNFVSGKPNETYADASFLIDKALNQIKVKGKTVLVIGTMTPWVEAVILSKKPLKVLTLEYATAQSEYPGLEFITPLEFRNRYKEGKLPMFDIIVTYSSVEHSGLGRYGDALNPWGDILTIARVSCVTSPDAKLIIGVPTTGKDRIEFNAHRVYGHILYPYLVTNWKLAWSSSGEKTPEPNEHWFNQPVYMFEKNL